MAPGCDAGGRRRLLGDLGASDEVRFVAEAIAAGLDGLRILGFRDEDAADPTALAVIGACIARAAELKDREHRSLAARIVGTFADALKKK